LDHSYTFQLSMWIIGTSVSQYELLSNLFKVCLLFAAEYEGDAGIGTVQEMCYEDKGVTVVSQSSLSG